MYDHGVTLAFGETTELTGGEHLVAARCRTDEVRKKFQLMFDRYQAIVEAHKTSDLRDSQPTKGNIAGGLPPSRRRRSATSRRSAASACRRRPGQARDPDRPGLWFIDSSSAAAEMVTLCAAAGYTVHLFPTGRAT
jgi:(2R)-sulfolactate sulfo-lyase subunit beta